MRTMTAHPCHDWVANEGWQGGGLSVPLLYGPCSSSLATWMLLISMSCAIGDLCVAGGTLRLRRSKEGLCMCTAVPSSWPARLSTSHIHQTQVYKKTRVHSTPSTPPTPSTTQSSTLHPNTLLCIPSSSSLQPPTTASSLDSPPPRSLIYHSHTHTSAFSFSSFALTFRPSTPSLHHLRPSR